MVVFATPDVAATRSIVTAGGPPQRRSARTAVPRRWSTEASRGRPGRGFAASAPGMLTPRRGLRRHLLLDRVPRDRQRDEQPEDEAVGHQRREAEGEQHEQGGHV